MKRSPASFAPRVHVLIDSVLQLHERVLHLPKRQFDPGERVHEVYVLRSVGSVAFAVISGVFQTPNLHSRAIGARDDSVEVEPAVFLDEEWKEKRL